MISEGVRRQEVMLVLFNVMPDATDFVLNMPLSPGQPPPAFHWGMVSGVAREDGEILIAAPNEREYDQSAHWTVCCRDSH